MRRIGRGLRVLVDVVSIHAPWEGCDSTSPIPYNSETWSFNSRTLGRVRRATNHHTTDNKMFQFTHPGGVRLYSSLLCRVSVCCFNSRTREGCDEITDQATLSQLMFQFTHPGGVRLPIASIILWQRRFQFTHPGGVRLKENANT